MLRVLFSGTSYPASLDDWRGMFLQHLVEALAAHPDTALQTWLPPGRLPPSAHPAWLRDDAAWLSTLMNQGGIAHLLRTAPAKGSVSAISLLRRQRRAYASSNAKLFHVNWLQNALALPRDGRPALVAALGSDMQLLRLPGIKVAMRRAFRGRQVAICPNADWMTPLLQDTFGDIARVECIPFGVNADWFDVERAPAAEGVQRWLCVSRLTARKLGPLFEWCAPYFNAGKRELHLFGPLQEQQHVPEWVHYHGPATAIRLCVEWFPRATGLITLSRHAEGRPQVMLEAMAAGLPVLASRLPAHEDMIEHALTGWLCDDPAGMAQGIEVIEDPMRNVEIGINSRAWVHQRIGTWSDCADRYVALYRELLNP